ncbi:hypothetical protein [Celerinatantimonas sp. YJH-8]|uniref:hypothetical protein n=1 Tax=Celerinatantimonas sp. YJH-8 TaxID=3228714 RepID=UPI0038C59796
MTKANRKVRFFVGGEYSALGIGHWLTPAFAALLPGYVFKCITLWPDGMSWDPGRCWESGEYSALIGAGIRVAAAGLHIHKAM